MPLSAGLLLSGSKERERECAFRVIRLVVVTAVVTHQTCANDFGVNIKHHTVSLTVRGVSAAMLYTSQDPARSGTRDGEAWAAALVLIAKREKEVTDIVRHLQHLCRHLIQFIRHVSGRRVKHHGKWKAYFSSQTSLFLLCQHCTYLQTEQSAFQILRERGVCVVKTEEVWAGREFSWRTAEIRFRNASRDKRNACCRIRELGDVQTSVLLVYGFVTTRGEVFSLTLASLIVFFGVFWNGCLVRYCLEAEKTQVKRGCSNSTVRTNKCICD